MTLTFDPETHTYEVDGEVWPSVTQILKDMGFVDSRWFTDYGRERGSLVHKIVKWHCMDVLDESTIDPVLRPYFDAWLKFIADSQYKLTATEKPMYNETYRFCGTLDHVGFLNEEASVIDIKTGVVLAATALQLSGYEILTGRRLKRYSLQLTDQGKYILTQFHDRNDRQVFLAALACWNWIKNH